MNKFIWLFALSLSVSIFAETAPQKGCKSKQASETKKCHNRALPEWLSVHGSFEYGFAFLPDHRIRWGEGDEFLDYVKNGGQKVLFPNWRISAGATIHGDHELTFTYQPIYLDTQVTMRQNFYPDGVAFNKGDAVNMRYYFPFYRLSYLWHAVNDVNWQWSLGLGLQLRNVTVGYTSVDGSHRFETRNVGPVPLLHTALRYTWNNGIWLGLDAQGFYAPIKYLNGSNSDVVGWIYELTLDSGFKIWKDLSGYGNVRLLGGGNSGNSNTPRPNLGKTPGTYSENILMTVAMNLGLKVEF